MTGDRVGRETETADRLRGRPRIGQAPGTTRTIEIAEHRAAVSRHVLRTSTHIFRATGRKMVVAAAGKTGRAMSADTDRPTTDGTTAAARAEAAAGPPALSTGETGSGTCIDDEYDGLLCFSRTGSREPRAARFLPDAWSCNGDFSSKVPHGVHRKDCQKGI